MLTHQLASQRQGEAKATATRPWRQQRCLQTPTAQRLKRFQRWTAWQHPELPVPEHDCRASTGRRNCPPSRTGRRLPLPRGASCQREMARRIETWVQSWRRSSAQPAMALSLALHLQEPDQREPALVAPPASLHLPTDVAPGKRSSKRASAQGCCLSKRGRGRETDRQTQRA